MNPALLKTLVPDHSQRSDFDGVAAVKQGSLLVIAGAPADVGTHVLVDDEVIIGRLTTGLQLRDGRTSRQHAAVRHLSDQVYLLRDMGSTNGTRLNGGRFDTEMQLEDGDRIHLGQTVVKFTLVDETEAKYLRRMERLAGTDPLTGLHAKHRFDSMLGDALRVCRATRTPLSALMMDMDGLKAVNDVHGHRMGAHTIGQVGHMIGALLVGRGEACRFGGDEFCAYLPGSGLDAACAVAEQIRAAVADAEFTLDGVTIAVTMSIGVAEAVAEIRTLDGLIGSADQALYRAKRAGRDRVSS